MSGPLPGRYLTVIPAVESTIQPDSVRTDTPGGVHDLFNTTAVAESANVREGEYSSRRSEGERTLILTPPATMPPGMDL